MMMRAGGTRPRRGGHGRAREGGTKIGFKLKFALTVLRFEYGYLYYYYAYTAGAQHYFRPGGSLFFKIVFFFPFFMNGLSFKRNIKRGDYQYTADTYCIITTELRVSDWNMNKLMNTGWIFSFRKLTDYNKVQ